MNDVTFSECKFTADIVPYMYGELSGAECSAFESHLLGCTGCTDEFASISNARYEVYDWKKLEFDPLATPHFAIPFETAAAETEATSWVEKIRSAFGHGWVPNAAYATIALVSIFAVVALLSKQDDLNIASTIESSNAVGANRNSEEPTAIPAAASEPKPVDETRVKPEIKRLASTTTLAGGQKRPRRNTKLSDRQQTEAKQASTRNVPKSVPTLSDFTEDEDTSLRLAELFEDIETKD